MAVGIPNNNSYGGENFEKDNSFAITYRDKMSYKDVLKTKPAEILKVADINNTGNFSGKSNNSIFFGDNLGILANLLQKYKGKVQLIYIDPPYAKNASFNSREQEHAYNDNLSGAVYLEFLRKRLILMRELLSPSGTIYVHLDETMAFPIKLIMDEVFGEENYVNWITRKKSNPKNSVTKRFGNISDFIMMYSKNPKMKFNPQYEPWDPEEVNKRYYSVEEETGRRFKKVPIHAPGTRNGETGKEWRGKLPPKGKHWQYTPAKLDELDRKGEIYWSSTGNPRRKVYLDQSKGKVVQDIWLDFKDAHNQNIKVTGYPTEKNSDLIERIIKASSDEGDLVLDAFMGSGTVPDVANSLNRKWIGIDNSELAIKTAINRLLHGSEIMGDFVNKNDTNQTALQLRSTEFTIYSDKEDKEFIEWCHQVQSQSTLV